MCEDEVGSAESEETTQIEAERAAEARRNAYYAEGGDEGGRCKNASSDAGAYRPMLKDAPALKDSRRTDVAVGTQKKSQRRKSSSR